MKKLLVAPFLVITSFSLSACGDNQTTVEKDSSQQVYRMVESQEMPSADPSLATDEVSFTALNNVYEGLYRLNKENTPQPAGAAIKATVSADGLVYTIQLRKEAKWSDGIPVTAKDYVYSWQRTVDPTTASEYAYMFAPIKNATKITNGERPKTELGIKAINDYELEINLEKATPYFDYLLAFPSFFPQRQDIIESFGKDYATKSDKAVYNGPFTLTDFDGPGTDTNWSYTKNKHYWDQATVKLEKITVAVVKEAPTALNLYETGALDDTYLSGELAQQMQNDPNIVQLNAASTFYLEMNQAAEQSPFKNANLRKAFSYTIDREALVKNILANGSTAAQGFVPKAIAKNPKTAVDFTKEANSVTYLQLDRKKAQQYWQQALKELGVSSLTVDLLVDDSEGAKKMAEYLQGSLMDTLKGLKVTVTSVPFAVRLDRTQKGDFQISTRGWNADYSDPISFLELLKSNSTNNRGKYANPQYDQLIEASETTDVNNPEKRWQDLLQAEKVMLEDMGVIPLYQKAEAHLRSPAIKDVVYHPTGAKFDFKWAYKE
ncbi:peptide ABC transporter substrate-binding protein [Enterococcus faecalis]